MIIFNLTPLDTTKVPAYDVRRKTIAEYASRNVAIQIRDEDTRINYNNFNSSKYIIFCFVKIWKLLYVSTGDVLVYVCTRARVKTTQYVVYAV